MESLALGSGVEDAGGEGYEQEVLELSFQVANQ